MLAHNVEAIKKVMNPGFTLELARLWETEDNATTFGVVTVYEIFCLGLLPSFSFHITGSYCSPQSL